eukprot:NODE_789_length_773_cov_828.412983_g603_i0.p1 GENE.NODE_789_length_773_cov_828.412983_g603_i0~~NODE_789_length_773_cov_828.412983_g603_i0.p1  ORF type:complete len:92 (+),score=1.37 NODE_789_length_773_cov_828.412983_g603_i0:375-650(+)
MNFADRTITFFGPSFQMCSAIHTSKTSQPYNPTAAVTSVVWANSRSLAATWEITIVFSSSAYLDVSVQRVCLPYGIIYLQYTGLPHSETSG